MHCRVDLSRRNCFLWEGNIVKDKGAGRAGGGFVRHAMDEGACPVVENFSHYGVWMDPTAGIMTTITIPKKVNRKEELIAIPRREYEAYLQFCKSVPSVKMTRAEKREWERAKKDYAQGKYVTLEKLEREMGLTQKPRTAAFSGNRKRATSTAPSARYRNRKRGSIRSIEVADGTRTHPDRPLRLIPLIPSQ